MAVGRQSLPVTSRQTGNPIPAGSPIRSVYVFGAGGRFKCGIRLVSQMFLRDCKSLLPTGKNPLFVGSYADFGA